MGSRVSISESRRFVFQLNLFEGGDIYVPEFPSRNRDALFFNARYCRSCRMCFPPPLFRTRRFSIGTEIIEKHDELTQSTAHQFFPLCEGSRLFGPLSRTEKKYPLFLTIPDKLSSLFSVKLLICGVITNGCFRAFD